MLGHITNSNSCSYSHNSSDELVLKVSSEKKDPWVYLDLTSFDISADEYKYIVYNYRLPTSDSAAVEKAQVFFCSDNNTAPKESASIMFDVTKNGQNVKKTLDLTSATYWGGDAIALRLDFFTNANVGDVCYLTSITFCKTYSDLQTALEN